MPQQDVNESEHPYLFHLVEKHLWDQLERAPGGNEAVYYPPTYKQDGFTHATANLAVLLTVANHFYTAIPGDWLCLKMTVASIEATGPKVVFEARAPVGNTSANFDDTSDELFPHIYGGIRSDGVLDVFPVKRDTKGNFIAVIGLTDR